MIRTQSTPKSKRAAGFTLVELLVVISIIAILSALTAGAVFKVIGVQRSNNTQLTIKSASSLLEKQWAYVIVAAKAEVIPPHVMGIADNDPTRARVIWIKLRLKQEFPMNFSEALYPYYLPIPGAPLTSADLPGKRYYYDRITQAFPQFVNNVNWPNIPLNYPNGSSPVQSVPPFTNSSQKLWYLESAYCLTMALQVNRGSIVFNEESFAPNALSTDIFVPQSPGGRALQFSGPKTLVDGWGFPLFFYRWPVGNIDFYPTSFSATALASSVSANARNQPYPDPLDPQGTLMDTRWTNANSQWFQQYCHSLSRSLYTEPVIVSSGPDDTLGITPPNNSPFLPDDMRYDPGVVNQAFDNIASYKLRMGGTGDK